MKRFEFIGFLFVACFLVACSSDQAELFSPDDEVGSIRVTLPVFEEEEMTRTNWTNNNGTLDYTFAITDTIGVFPTNGDQISFSLSKGAGTKSFTFAGAGWGVKNGFSYGAYLPFDKTNFFRKNSEIPLSYIGQKQEGLANNNTTVKYLGLYDYMACGAKFPQNGSLDILLDRLGLRLKIAVTIPDAGTYKSATISSNKQELITEAALDISKKDPMTTATKKSKKLSLSLINFTTTKNNQVVYLYMFCLPMDLTGNTLTLGIKALNGDVYTGNLVAKNGSFVFNKNTTKNMSSTLTKYTGNNPDQYIEDLTGTLDQPAVTVPDPGAWN